MQVSVEKTDGLERRITVQVPGADIQEKTTTKLRELSKQVRIKGFRPGRVPMSVIKQRYGKQARQDIVNEAMQESLQQAIQDEDLRPASMPRLEAEPKDLESGDVEFSALIEVYPEVATLDIGSIEIEKPKTKVASKDVKEMLNTLREQRKTLDPVERSARKGDHVAVEYAAETKDGRVPEEGTSRMAIVMGESGFDKLEQAIAKMEPGEETNVKLKFPEDFREESLQDKKAKVDLTLVSVSESNLPELDEEFIKSFGIEDGSMDTLKKEIKGNLKRELKQATSSLLKTNLVDQLVKAVPDLEVPKSVVRDEATSMAAQMMQQHQQQQQKAQPPDPQIVELFMPQAEDRVRAGLLLGELAQQNELRVDPAKVREAIESVASTYEQPAEVMQLYYGNQRLMQQVESSVLEEQVVDWVLENAKVTSKEMSFQDVITGATQAGQQA